jgi:2',3'-cyclic-nucleotide 2'-phosphodiesterase (5'-nucleotidase family)
LARRAAIFDQIAQEHSEVLHLDAGNMYGRRSDDQKAQTEFLMKESAKLGYTVLGVGQWDLNYGLEFLRSMEKQYGYTYISANLGQVGKDGLLFPPTAVVEKAGVRIGLISVIGQNFKITSMSAQPDNFVIESPRDALEKYLPGLREQCDVLILLSAANTRDTRELLTDLGDEAGIDICIEGADTRQYQRLNKVGETFLVSANPQGKYVGQLDLVLSQGGEIEDAVLTIHELGAQAPVDQELQAEVDAFLESNKALASKTALKPEPVHGSASEKFLGVQNCANCHQQDWESFNQTGHAKAWQTLVAKGQTSNPECVGCHVTGWDFLNGFDPTVSANGRNTLFNVQCEACHGYGTEHARDGVWAAQAKASCTGCHTPDFDPDFDYASDWAKIAH